MLSHATDLYFDMPYEPDPEERGYYWATRFTTTRNTFNYMPDRVYDNMEVDLFGRPLDQEEVCKNVGCVPLLSLKEDNIEGRPSFKKNIVLKMAVTKFRLVSI